MESRQGVVWLPRSAVIVPQDENVFEGTFGKVWKVTIRGAASILEWIEFARKTMKVEKNKENRLQRCRVERSLLWEITGNLATADNDLRVGKQLLFSKPKIVVKQTVFNCAHIKDPRPTSSI